MSASQAQCHVREDKNIEQASEALEGFDRAPIEKLIVTMQVCVHCRRAFQLKRGRVQCPYCQGSLRSKVTVIKIP